jgi:hypothetical protein
MEDTNIENDKTELILFNALEPRHQRAIELRYKGCTFNEIAEDELVNGNRNNVNLWFVVPAPHKDSPAGLLYDAYQEYKKYRRQEREIKYNAAVELIYESALKAMDVIAEIMGKDSDSKANKARSRTQVEADKVRLTAAQDILDRCVGKIQSIDLTTKGEALSIGSMSYDDLLNEAKKRGLDVSKYTEANSGDNPA